MISLDKCNFCHIQSENLKKCSKCRSVAYCSQDHQKLDWKEGGHKLVCDGLATIRSANNRRIAEIYRGFIKSLPITISSPPEEVL